MNRKSGMTMIHDERKLDNVLGIDQGKDVSSGEGGYQMNDRNDIAGGGDGGDDIVGKFIVVSRKQHPLAAQLGNVNPFETITSSGMPESKAMMPMPASQEAKTRGDNIQNQQHHLINKNQDAASINTMDNKQQQQPIKKKHIVYTLVQRNLPTKCNLLSSSSPEKKVDQTLIISSDQQGENFVESRASDLATIHVSQKDQTNENHPPRTPPRKAGKIFQAKSLAEAANMYCNQFSTANQSISTLQNSAPSTPIQESIPQSMPSIELSSQLSKYLNVKYTKTEKVESTLSKEEIEKLHQLFFQLDQQLMKCDQNSKTDFVFETFRYHLSGFPRGKINHNYVFVLLLALNDMGIYHAEMKYKNKTEFSQEYSGVLKSFEKITKREVGTLVEIANWMAILCKFLKPNWNKGIFMMCTTKMVEGPDGKYVSGSKPTVALKRRIQVFEHEGDIQPLKRINKKREQELDLEFESNQDIEDSFCDISNVGDVPDCDEQSCSSLIIADEESKSLLATPNFNRKDDSLLEVCALLESNQS